MMNSRILLVIVLLTSINSFSQTKYYIYFKDKGTSQNGILNKTSDAFLAAERELTPAAIERRKQVMGENYITEEDIPISEKYVQSLKATGIKIENKLKWFNAVTSYLTDEQAKEIQSFPFVLKLETVRSVKYIKPIEIQETPSPKSFRKVSTVTSLNYGSSFIQDSLSDVPAVHDLGITGKGVRIGILDTGFRWKTHPALKNLKIVAEKDFIQNDDVTENQTGDAPGQDSHGTNCLGLMAGNDPGNLIGPAFEASIVLAKTENISSEKNVEEDNYAAALEWMEGLGVQITTSSLGYNIFDAGQRTYSYDEMNGNTTKVAQAVNLAFQRGVTSLTAAGNDASFWGVGKGGISSPGDAFNVITVGAVTSKNAMASFSSRGPTSDGRIKPEIVAMGVSDYISIPSGTYGFGNGTSYATPIAAGVAGLLKSCWAHLTNVQMRKTFLECGDNTATPDNDRGYGLISAKKAIAYPNLQLVNGNYMLNKIFINNSGINSSSVKLYYKTGNASFQSAAMNYDGTLKYNFSLPGTSNGTQIEFYFEYSTTTGTLVREPASRNYEFTYGSLVVNNVFTDVDNVEEIPTEFSLAQNYPNPFNPETTISYKIASGNHVILKVYDMLGREVKTLVDEFKQPGNYSSQLSLHNSPLSSGVYFYRLQAGSFVQTKKMLLVK